MLHFKILIVRMMMTLAIMTMKIMMMMMMTTLDGRDPRLQQKQPQLPLLLPMPWQQRLFRISSLL